MAISWKFLLATLFPLLSSLSLSFPFSEWFPLGSPFFFFSLTFYFFIPIFFCSLLWTSFLLDFLYVLFLSSRKLIWFFHLHLIFILPFLFIHSLLIFMPFYHWKVCLFYLSLSRSYFNVSFISQINHRDLQVTNSISFHFCTSISLFNIREYHRFPDYLSLFILSFFLSLFLFL